MNRPGLKGPRRALSLTLSVLLVLVIITLLLLVIIPEISGAINKLIKVIPGLLKQLEGWLTEKNALIRANMGLNSADEGAVREQFNRAYQVLLGGLNQSPMVVKTATQWVFNFFIGLVFAIYILFSKETLKAQVNALLDAHLSTPRATWTKKVIGMTVHTFGSFLGGQCLQSFLMGLLTTGALALFGFPYAVLIGLISFVCAFIPLLGPYLAGIVGAILVFTARPESTLWFVLLFFVVQQVEGSVVYPRIMSNAIEIPSLWVLVAVTLGGGIMGIPGMLLLIPITAVIYRLVKESTAARLEKKAAIAKGARP